MSMSSKSRREYLNTMRKRYRAALTRADKTGIIDEAIKVLSYHRKYIITALNQLPTSTKTKTKRHRPLKYIEALPAIQIVWEA